MTPPRIILDIRGLLLHSLFRGEDPDGELGNEDKTVNTAEYGFNKFLETYLNPIVANNPPLNIIAVWDEQSDYRLSVFPAYKKARKEKEQDPKQQEQIERLMKFAKLFLASIGALQVKCKGTEADDIIALLCQRLPGRKTVYTVDGDLTQLATPMPQDGNIPEDMVFMLLKGVAVEGDYKGVPFPLVPVYKALVGDYTDGYGGLKGFGPKAWDNFISYFDFDGAEQLQTAIYDNDLKFLQVAIDSCDGKPKEMLENIKENWSQVSMMLDLATLHPEIADSALLLEIRKPQWYRRLADGDKALHVLDQAGCAHHCEHYRKFFPTVRLVTEDNADILPKFVALMNRSPIVAFDYESFDTLKHEDFQRASKTGNFVDVLSQRITGASFTAGPNLQHTIYVSVGHADTNNLGIDLVEQLLVEAQRRSTLVVQNAMFENPVSQINFGKKVIQGAVDTRIMASYVDENESMGLKDMSKRLLNYQQITYRETLDACGAADMSEATGQEVLQYGADDAICTATLWHLFDTILHIEGTADFFYKNELRPNDVLADSFLDGWNVDFDRMKEMANLDAENVTQGTLRLRELLEQNCAEESPEAVDRYVEADQDYLTLQAVNKATKKKGSGDSVTNEDIRGELKSVKKGFLKQSIYAPVVTYKKEVKFKPTPTQITKVMKALGFSEGLESVAVSRISERVMAAKEEELNSKQAAFIEVLSEAADQIKRREGDTYETFEATCRTVLEEGQEGVSSGDELNFGSPKQMQALLYLKMGLPVRVRTMPQKGSTRQRQGFPGSPATNERAIALAKINDMAEDDWRKEALELVESVKASMTRNSLYYTPYPLWQHPRDGKVHGSIMNASTTTRRPIGGSPNYLQIAKRGAMPDEEGNYRVNIRSLFVPESKERVVVAQDFSGQELRITASESLDPVMTDAYIGKNKKDIHSVTACGIAIVVLTQMFPEALEHDIIVDASGAVNYKFFIDNLKDENSLLNSYFNEIRKISKVQNFLIVYGGTCETLALKLGVSKAFAEKMFNATFERYGRLQPWQNEVINFARRHGYVKTAYGSRRHLSRNLFADDNSTRRRMERQAVNATIQGCAADILKEVLTEMSRQGVRERFDAKGIIPVYDEIVADVPKVHAAEYINTMNQIMSITPPGHAIPMVPETSIGRTWGEVHELGAYPSEKAINERLEIIGTRAA